MRRPPRTQLQLLMLIGAPRCLFPTRGRTRQKSPAVKREPADKVRLVDRGSADRQGKIYPISTGLNITNSTRADQMVACETVSTIPTTPEKFDPSVVRLSITNGRGARKGSTNGWQLSRSVPALCSARHFPLHDCDETSACSFDSIATHGQCLSSLWKA